MVIAYWTMSRHSLVRFRFKYGKGHSSFLVFLLKYSLCSGTLDYQAPEVAKGNNPSMPNDIWSFGVLLFQLYTGQSSVLCTCSIW